MTSSVVRGRFVWHEILTSDPKAVADFYTKFVGWKTQQWPQNPDYTLFVTNEVPMAGLMQMPEEVKAMGVPPHWLTYIGTPDLDETLNDVATHGGTLLKEAMEIPDVGRFAVIRDPQGAAFVAFTPVQDPRPDMTPTLGDFSWHELVTDDWTAALDFYRELFGWEKTDAMDMGPEMGTYQMFGLKGVSLGGTFNKPPSMPAPPHWMPYAMIRDSKRAAEVIKQRGGQILNGPMEVPGGDWIVQGLDPQGAAFAVHSKNPAAAQAPASPKAKSPARAKTKVKKASPSKSKKRAAKRAAAKRPSPKPKKRAAKKKAAARSSARPKKRAVGRKRAVKRSSPRPKKRAAKKKAAPRRGKKRATSRRRATPKRTAKKK